MWYDDVMRKVLHAKTKCLAFLSAAALYAVFYIGNIPCIFRFATGVPCPGCGMTRAVFSLITLDFPSAAFYHPMVFFLPVLFLFIWKDGRLFRSKRINLIVLISIGVLFLAAYFIRLYLFYHGYYEAGF